MTGAFGSLWTGRSARERALAVGASAMLALALAYAFVWLPVSRERDRLLVRVPELRAESMAMKRDAEELERLRSAAKNPASARTVILQAGAASQLAEKAFAIAERDSGTFRVVIESSSAQQGLTWIARLQAATGIRVENIQVSSSGGGDLVRIQASVVAAQ